MESTKYVTHMKSYRAYVVAESTHFFSHSLSSLKYYCRLNGKAVKVLAQLYHRVTMSFRWLVACHPILLALMLSHIPAAFHRASS